MQLSLELFVSVQYWFNGDTSLTHADTRLIVTSITGLQYLYIINLQLVLSSIF
jgi:hypothetical protein